MTKGKKSTAKKEHTRVILENWNNWLLLPTTQERILAMEGIDVANQTFSFQLLLNEAAGIWEKENITLPEFWECFNRSSAAQARDASVLEITRHLRNLIKQEKPTHWEKRSITKELGILNARYSAADLISGALKPFGIDLIERSRDSSENKVKRYQDLYEFAGMDTPSSASVHVSSDNGYYIVDTNKSVIFYSYDSSSNASLNIELVVIRGIACSASFADSFFQWLISVVEMACNERRNVRPGHPGHMAQIGLNMGPHHARVMGWAKSFTKNLDDETKAAHDTDAIGAISLTWSLAQSVMPQEVITCVASELVSLGLPSLATRSIAEGQGFKIQAAGKEYYFPLAERAPPEAYLTRGYTVWSHIDQTSSTYAFAFCVGRHTVQQSLYPDGGANFVDVSLKVLVKQDQGTMLAFKPRYMHGTTVSAGAENSIVSITLSSRVAEAWKEAKEANGVAHITTVLEDLQI